MMVDPYSPMLLKKLLKICYLDDCSHSADVEKMMFLPVVVRRLHARDLSLGHCL